MFQALGGTARPRQKVPVRHGSGKGEYVTGGFNFQNTNCRTLPQFTRQYIHTITNPNPKPIANHKLYPNPEITQLAQIESSYACDYRKVGDIRFSANLEYCSRVLHSAFCILQITPAHMQVYLLENSNWKRYSNKGQTMESSAFSITNANRITPKTTKYIYCHCNQT